MPLPSTLMSWLLWSFPPFLPISIIFLFSPSSAPWPGTPFFLASAFLSSSAVFWTDSGRMVYWKPVEKGMLTRSEELLGPVS